jgi:hypothetical protein
MATKKLPAKSKTTAQPTPARQAGIQSLEIGMRVLEALATGSSSMSLKELSLATRLAPSKLHRYLVSLVRGGMVTQYQASGRYDFGEATRRYGVRGASLAEDPDRAYREKMAYPYFLRRGLDLLAPNGLGVYLVPAGFMTGRSTALAGLREKVLKRHHLAAAFRLPSVTEDRREAVFPGAMLVTDLLFFRARGGELDAVDEGDRAILAGDYFKEYPRHILGREIGDDHGDDDQTRRPRWGYQVQGTITRLPELVERPVCGECRVVTFPVGVRVDANAPLGLTLTR